MKKKNSMRSGEKTTKKSTPLQQASHKQWQQLGTLARTRSNLKWLLPIAGYSATYLENIVVSVEIAIRAEFEEAQKRYGSEKRQ